jgi:cytochrome b
MGIIHRIRIYHATLAILSILAYLTGEFGIIHSWLGYGVAIVIALRLLWALSGNPQVGLMRFYPSFEGLNLSNAFTHPAITKIFMLGIALSLLAVTATGVIMDKGESIGLTGAKLVPAAYADDDDHDGYYDKKEGGFFEEALEETHEFFANLLLIFVALHVTYLLLFKLPLAKFMLFVPKRIDKDK